MCSRSGRARPNPPARHGSGFRSCDEAPAAAPKDLPTIRPPFPLRHVTPLDPAHQARVDRLTDLLVQKGHAAGETLRMAQGIVYDTVQAQAGMLAYLDDFRLLL